MMWSVCKNGYYQLVRTDGSVSDFIYFCPFTGEEFPTAKLLAVQDEIYSYLRQIIESDDEFDELCNNLHLYNSSEFDIVDTPESLRHLLAEREWFDKLIKWWRNMHKNGWTCPGFHGFIRGQYGSFPMDILSLLPINYCPFCGIALPAEFQQEYWWEKEFKNFDWYKKHKMFDWAEEPVDGMDIEYPWERPYEES